MISNFILSLWFGWELKQNEIFAQKYAGPPFQQLSEIWRKIFARSLKNEILEWATQCFLWEIFMSTLYLCEWDEVKNKIFLHYCKWWSEWMWHRFENFQPPQTKCACQHQIIEPNFFVKSPKKMFKPTIDWVHWLKMSLKFLSLFSSRQYWIKEKKIMKNLASLLWRNLGCHFTHKKIKFQIAYKTSNTLKPLAQQIIIKWNDFHNVLLRLNCILNK